MPSDGAGRKEHCMLNDSLMSLPATQRVVGLVVIIACLIFTPLAIAAERGQINGVVSDQTGAKIAGARVVVHDRAGAIVAEARTDESGGFKINDIAAGHYTIGAEATGFTQAEAVSVDVPAKATSSVNLRLDVAAITDRVVVTATRTMAQTAELGGS